MILLNIQASTKEQIKQKFIESNKNYYNVDFILSSLKKYNTIGSLGGVLLNKQDIQEILYTLINEYNHDFINYDFDNKRVNLKQFISDLV